MTTQPDAASSGPGERRPQLAFVLEQTLGHVTHSRNLRALLASSKDADITFLPIEFATLGRAAHLPGWSNWTVRAGIRARAGLRRRARRGRIDAIFVHTQVPAVLLGRWARRIPMVVSLDATPMQYDLLGEHYAHATSSMPVERLKRWANRRCYQRAAHVVTWSAWAKSSVVDDYGIPGDRVTVVAPGVDIRRWAPTAAGQPQDDPMRILFVGADLARKGGHLLLEAARILRSDPAVDPFELHLVTRSAVEPEEGVVVHNGLDTNSPELIDLYHRSNVFCLPTLADCLPMVLSEAGVAGLALVSTDVGAIGEIVRDGETGLLIPPGDCPALVAALRTLLDDRAECARMGRAAEALVRREFDAAVNAERLVTLLIDLAMTGGHA